jgi:hypothetical protein
MEVKSKVPLRKILQKGGQLSTNWRLLEEEESLCGSPCDEQKRACCHRQHDSEPKL